MQDNQLDPKVINTNILSTYHTHTRAHARTHARTYTIRQTNPCKTDNRQNAFDLRIDKTTDRPADRKTDRKTNKQILYFYKTLPYLYICKEFEKENKSLYANNKVIDKLKTIGKKDLLSSWKNAICKCVHET